MTKNLFSAIVIISCIFLYTYTDSDHNEWFTKEQTMREVWRQQIAQEYWNNYVLQDKDQDHELIQQVLLTRSSIVDTHTIISTLPKLLPRK